MHTTRSVTDTYTLLDQFVQSSRQ